MQVNPKSDLVPLLEPSMAPVSEHKPKSSQGPQGLASLAALPFSPHLHYSLFLSYFVSAILASCYSSNTPGMT